MNTFLMLLKARLARMTKDFPRSPDSAVRRSFSFSGSHHPARHFGSVQVGGYSFSFWKNPPCMHLTTRKTFSSPYGMFSCVSARLEEFFCGASRREVPSSSGSCLMFCLMFGGEPIRRDCPTNRWEPSAFARFSRRSGFLRRSHGQCRSIDQRSTTPGLFSLYIQHGVLGIGPPLKPKTGRHRHPRTSDLPKSRASGEDEKVVSAEAEAAVAVKRKGTKSIGATVS